MQATDCFARDYRQAREMFLAAAHPDHWQQETHVLPGLDGPSGEILAMDTARCAPAHADTLLMLSSGVHGVEGFCGSAAQVALLLDETLPARLERAHAALLMIHAVNPWGFAHLRRVNEDNTDLNRNGLTFSRLPDNPAYQVLEPLLLPACWPPDATARAALARHLEEQGLRAVQAALTRGQYHSPDGLFYGGTAPCWSTRTLQQVLQTHARDYRRVIWIDLHSGLGPCGCASLLAEGKDQAERLRAERIWGSGVVQAGDDDAVSTEVLGTLQQMAGRLLPRQELTRLTLEFGTLPPLQVLQALCADHWLHRHPETDPAQARAIRAHLKQAFCRDDPVWQTQVVSATREAVWQALDDAGRHRLAHSHR